VEIRFLAGFALKFFKNCGSVGWGAGNLLRIGCIPSATVTPGLEAGWNAHCNRR
jgi:hypothetical protein